MFAGSLTYEMVNCQSCATMSVGARCSLNRMMGLFEASRCKSGSGRNTWVRNNGSQSSSMCPLAHSHKLCLIGPVSMRVCRFMDDES